MTKHPAQTLAKVISTEVVAERTHLIWLEAPEVARSAIPGQFVMLKCAGGTFLRRPLSIHRLNPDKTRLAFLFASVGAGTEWLSTLKHGDSIDLLGPLGNGFKITPGAGEAILVAGGLGVAPLGFLAEELRISGKSVTFLYGTAHRTLMCADHVLPVSTPVLSTEDGSRGRKGYITGYLKEYLSSSSQVFACGPTPMYRTLARMTELKDRRVQVSMEIRMACGLGVCNGCTINTRQGLQQVCKHGPVFNLHDVLWDEVADI